MYFKIPALFYSGFYYSTIMIEDSLSDWDSNPTITTIESAALPMNNLQFPTITICPG